MTDEAAKGKDLERYRVVEADKDGETPTARRPWTRRAIYRSPICVAVHLSFIDPDCRNDAEVDVAKMALFRYLRQVHQAVMDHGLILPLAAVIEAPQHNAKTLLAKALEGWGSDQTWHRGGFTLYPETSGDDTRKRLRDLLSPTGEAMKDLETAITRDQSWFAARLREKQIAFEDQSKAHAADIAGLCAQRLDDDPPDKGASDQFPLLTGWKDRTIQTAKHMAEGRRQP